MKIEIIKKGSALDKGSKHTVSFQHGKVMIEKGWAKCLSGEMKTEAKTEAKEKAPEDAKKKVDGEDLLKPSNNKLKDIPNTK